MKYPINQNAAMVFSRIACHLQRLGPPKFNKKFLWGQNKMYDWPELIDDLVYFMNNRRGCPKPQPDLRDWCSALLVQFMVGPMALNDVCLAAAQQAALEEMRRG